MITGKCKRCGKEMRFSDPPKWASDVFGTPKHFKVPKYCHRCREDLRVEESYKKKKEVKSNMDENEIEDLIDGLKNAGFPCIIVLGDDDQGDEDDGQGEDDDENEESDE